LKCLNKAVAVNSDTSEVVVATRFWQRIGIDLLRGSCRAFHRRLVDKNGGLESAGREMGFVTGLTVTGES
jgi:hypothetical protein